MTNSEQALREFAEKIVPVIINASVLCNTEEIIEAFTGDLTALISEHYYPKEFTEWLVKNSLPEGNCVLVRARLVRTELLTYDEAFKYWKENEQ